MLMEQILIKNFFLISKNVTCNPRYHRIGQAVISTQMM